MLVSTLKIPSFPPNGDVYPVYIDTVGFKLTGTLHGDPTTRSLPAHLFVSPLETERVDKMTCVRVPLPKSPFYWSEGPDGNTVIPEDDWEKYGIPNLELETIVGSHWEDEEYACVRDLLGSRGYDLDGKQYAHDHGHPELIHGEPRAPLVKLISLTINL